MDLTGMGNPILQPQPVIDAVKFLGEQIQDGVGKKDNSKYNVKWMDSLGDWGYVDEKGTTRVIPDNLRGSNYSLTERSRQRDARRADKNLAEVKATGLRREQTEARLIGEKMANETRIANQALQGTLAGIQASSQANQAQTAATLSIAEKQLEATRNELASRERLENARRTDESEERRLRGELMQSQIGEQRYQNDVMVAMATHRMQEGQKADIAARRADVINGMQRALIGTAAGLGGLFYGRY